MSYDIMMLLIGAAIGFLSSVGVIIIQRFMDSRGKIRIFYKRISIRAKNINKWGIFKEGNIKHFRVPMSIEIQNTSAVARVVRDFALYTYLDNDQIRKFIQVELEEVTHRTGNNITEKVSFNYGSSDGAYSFLLQPRSIAHFSLVFLLLSINEDDENFNNLRIEYYDERNKKHVKKICDIQGGWDEIQYNPDKDWIML